MAGAGVGMVVGAAIGLLIVVIDNETLTEYATMVRKLISALAFAGVWNIEIEFHSNNYNLDINILN
ncbi:hypothetical protein C2845_PM04G05610 [Panicum miliaceum]|uniref:Uncharacterized protein n=1 Tax=Panicum miliaceum TaxID=4540 RepID=A0A3L6QS54_PANMI|nr:hypothetical protein C2845_PM04G05610 [Panicum miliaceum]